MLLPYLKKIALFGIISILFTGHVSSQQSKDYDPWKHICVNGKIPVLRDVRDPSSVIKCISEAEANYDKSLLPEWARKYKVIGVGPKVAAISEEDYNEILEHRFDKNKIIEWFVIGLVIIAIMSLPINILWRFRLKIPACLFAMVTALAVIAIPFIFGSYISFNLLL
ncbi:Uncharacterised protein [Candidatus Bartonella washoeensis]|nr:hypothetical protein [Bartonella washoeensis]SPU26592.1 Uncharacterised protein [Bartonella washoeensis]